MICGYVCPCSLLSTSSPLPLLVKAMGLLVNLTQDGSAAWGDVLERVGLLRPLEEMLQSHGSNGSGGVVEQCLCVLVNLSTCSEQVRNTLAHSNTIIAAVSSILVGLTIIYGQVYASRSLWSASYWPRTNIKVLLKIYI